jgi:hypothetical protein
MRNGRKVIISAIVSLGAAGSIFTSSAVAMTAAQATTTTVAASATPAVFYHA